MGNKGYVPVNIANSPLYYELPSVVAEPVDHLIDFDSLFYGIAHLIKVGGHSRDDKNLKGELVVVDSGQDGFTLQKTFDKTMLGLDEDYVTLHSFRCLKKRGMIVEEIRVAPDLTLREISCIVVHRPKMRVECWRQTISQQRGTSLEAEMLLAGILKEACPDETVSVKADQECLVHPGWLSVRSEDLKGKITYDELWANFMKALRSQDHNPLKKSSTAQDVKPDKGWSEAFDVSMVGDRALLEKIGLPMPKGNERNLTYLVRANKKLGTAVSMLVDQALMIYYQIDYFAISREPLVVEHWVHKHGDRRCGLMVRAVVDWTLTTVIKAHKEAEQGKDFFNTILALVRSGGTSTEISAEEVERASSSEGASTTVHQDDGRLGAERPPPS